MEGIKKKNFKILTIVLLILLTLGSVGCSCSDSSLTSKNGYEASRDILYNGVMADKYLNARLYLSKDKIGFLMEKSDETEEERIERLALRGYGIVAEFYKIELATYDKKTGASTTEIEYSAPSYKRFHDIVSKNIEEGYYEHKSDKQVMTDMSGILKSSDPKLIETKKFVMKFEPNPNKFKMDEDEGKLVEEISEPWLIWTNPEDMIASFKKK